MHVWINGEFVLIEHARVSAFDAGFQHAVGLFETMLARGGRVVIADQVHNLDWPYIERWCRDHDTLDVLEQVRRDAAELMGE